MAPFGGGNAVVVLMVCTWLGLQYSACVGEIRLPIVEISLRRFNESGFSVVSCWPNV